MEARGGLSRFEKVREVARGPIASHLLLDGDLVLSTRICRLLLPLSAHLVPSCV